MSEEFITAEDYITAEDFEFLEGMSNNPRVLFYPTKFYPGLISAFLRHVDLIESRTKELGEAYKDAEKPEHRKVRYKQYANLFFKELLECYAKPFEQTNEYQDSKRERERIQDDSQRVKREQEKFEQWKKNEIEALDKMYYGYNENLHKEIGELKSILDEKINENSRYREFFDDFLEQEEIEKTEEVKEEIKSQPVAKGYICGKYHYPKTPGSLEEAKKPWGCRVCGATGEGVDSVWTMPAKIKGGFIKSAEIASPLLGESQEKLDGFINAMNEYNLQGIADETERKKHSPYFKQRRKNAKEN